MSERIIILAIQVLLGLHIIAISNAAALISDEHEARKFAEESKYYIFLFFENLEYKDDHRYGFDDDADRERFKYLTDLNENAKKFDYQNFEDSELKYIFGRIVNLTVERGEPFFKIRNIINELHKLSKDAAIEKYHENKNFKNLVAYNPYIKNLTGTSNNPEELEFYWIKWREESSHWAKKNLKLILNKLKNLPDVSPLLRNYNFNELEKLMDDLKPLYTEMHAYIRDLLHTKYGDTNIKSDGLIPHHLFEQAMAQVWSPTNESIFEKMFPYKNLPEFEPSLYFKAMEFYTHAAYKFYRDLGFTPFSENMWINTVVEKEYYIKEDDDCEARIYNSSPVLRLEFCKKRDYKRLLQAYEGLARLYYAYEMIGLPSYFFDSQDLEFAIGKAVILSASKYHSLQRIDLINNDFNITEDVEMNRLLRKSIDALVKIRLDFVHIKLIADLFLGKIKLEELNEKYWQLMEKYVGVGPPLNHKTDSPDTFDMPVAFYDLITYIFSNQDSKKIDSEILSYQIYQKLCEISGKYPKEPLHLCDFQNSKPAGDVLKKVMKLGASKPFNDVLAEIIPENPKVSAGSIMEYYSPVTKLLTEKNKEANIEPGWK